MLTFRIVRLGAFCVFLWLCFGVFSAVGRSPVPLDLSNIGKLVSYYSDSTAKLTLAQITSPELASRFRPGDKDILNFGNTSSAIWIRFQVRHHGFKKVYAVLDAPNIEQIDLYAPDANGGTWHVRAGSLFRQTKGVKVDNDYVFDLPPLSPDTVATVYMRLETNNIMVVPLKLSTAEAMVERVPYKDRIEYAYIGVLIALLLFNLFLYFSLKDKAYLYYTLYVLSLSLYMLIYIRGYSFLLGPDLRIFMSKHPHVFLSLSVVTSLLFCRRLLNLEVTVPSMLKYYYFFGVCGIILFFLSAAGFKSTSTSIAQLLTISVALTLWISGIIAYRRGLKAAKYYVAAWSLIWISVAIVTLSLAGIIEVNEYTMQLVPLASTGELLLLSFALGDRYNTIIAAEQRARDENLRLVQTHNLKLEERVKERTQELNQFFSIVAHDLRSPLNSLMSILELNDMQVLNNEELRALLKENTANIHRINSTVNTLLHWAKGRMEGSQSVPVTFDVKAVLDELLPAYMPLIQRKDIELEMQTAGALSVYADRNEIVLVLRNLIDNAIKFTPKNGQISIGLSEDTGVGKVAVSNSLEDAGALQRAIRAATAENGVMKSTDYSAGVGLGLNLCKTYLQNNGSDLSVTGGNGKIFFSFELPVKKEGS
ncbi:sensor histidine kinase [Pedobacter faecalis]|uniref:sensor histidine kinase n=1 Tax=Pedobacter faecalis TaxID=3041495 RepID=UPI00255004C7|nr:sensor histidine kinase [Pedobacter sp. ELA7]